MCFYQGCKFQQFLSSVHCSHQLQTGVRWELQHQPDSVAFSWVRLGTRHLSHCCNAPLMKGQKCHHNPLQYLTKIHKMCHACNFSVSHLLLLINFLYIFFLKFSTVTQHSDRGRNRTCINSFITHPIKGCTTPTRSTPLILYEQQCRFFYVLQETAQWKSYETEPTVFRPCPRRLECITICRCHNKGSTFSSVILQAWVLV